MLERPVREECFDQVYYYYGNRELQRFIFTDGKPGKNEFKALDGSGETYSGEEGENVQFIFSYLECKFSVLLFIQPSMYLKLLRLTLKSLIMSHTLMAGLIDVNNLKVTTLGLFSSGLCLLLLLCTSLITDRFIILGQALFIFHSD